MKILIDLIIVVKKILAKVLKKFINWISVSLLEFDNSLSFSRKRDEIIVLDSKVIHTL